MIKKGIGTKNMIFLDVNTIIGIKSIILNVKIRYRILFRVNIVQKVTKTFLQSMKIERYFKVKKKHIDTVLESRLQRIFYPILTSEVFLERGIYIENAYVN